ncbi:hypothetical protein [Amycolatopsis sp. PS_44_ISF1]|uniref:hypothetical protein n=1 Tax=Amycolatopsis sp. PS_44_ISF1 TaxID=2974917 RepID=UPI0028DFBB93|nr:hypothetical protein [Amycolatopsis sp. PS_44_ISF1]MDT8913565.1 hypothetical protein [Amycolatopsis sp. PS_44_ISF1]
MVTIHVNATSEPPGLPTGAWDLTSFLENAKSTIQLWGGLALMAFGAIGLVWGGVLLIRKLMANPQASAQHQSWTTIALLVLVGGGLATGGWSLVSAIGSGGQKTIEDLGGGTVIVQRLDELPG